MLKGLFVSLFLLSSTNIFSQYILGGSFNLGKSGIDDQRAIGFRINPEFGKFLWEDKEQEKKNRAYGINMLYSFNGFGNKPRDNSTTLFRLGFFQRTYFPIIAKDLFVSITSGIQYDMGIHSGDGEPHRQLMVGTIESRLSYLIKDKIFLNLSFGNISLSRDLLANVYNLSVAFNLSQPSIGLALILEDNKFKLKK